MKIKQWIILLSIFVGGGCSDGWVDISNRPEIIDHGDGYYYGTGSVLVVLVPIKIDKYSDRCGLGLMGLRGVKTNSVHSIDPDAQGIITTGTLITVERVMYYKNWENGDSVVPVGRVLNGEYAGKQVNMEEVRQRYFLKRVDDTSTNNADVYTPGFMWGAGLKPGVPRP